MDCCCSQVAPSAAASHWGWRAPWDRSFGNSITVVHRPHLLLPLLILLLTLLLLGTTRLLVRLLLLLLWMLRLLDRDVVLLLVVAPPLLEIGDGEGSAERRLPGIVVTHVNGFH